MDFWDHVKKLVEICLPGAPFGLPTAVANAWTTDFANRPHSLLFNSAVFSIVNALNNRETRNRVAEWFRDEGITFHDLSFLRVLPFVGMAVLEKVLPNRPQSCLLIESHTANFSVILDDDDVITNDQIAEPVPYMMHFARIAFIAGIARVEVVIARATQAECDETVQLFLDSFNLPDNLMPPQDGHMYHVRVMNVFAGVSIVHFNKFR